MDDETKRASAALGPKDHAEAVALFRAQVIGPVLARGTLGRGELADALRELAAERFRPPGSDVSRSYGVSTLERWYYRYRDGGLAALRPRSSRVGVTDRARVGQTDPSIALSGEAQRSCDTSRSAGRAK